MTPDSASGTIPCFINLSAGTASAIEEVIRRDDRLSVRECDAGALAAAVRRVIEAGGRRVVVAGGDGTIAAAAAALASTDVELAIIPAGTLNHFATSHGIPADPAAAVELAVNGSCVPVDVGFVNDRLFLNTSSVGAYIRFVRARERYERYVGYFLGSALASVRTFLRLRTYRVRLEIEGVSRQYSSPLVFVGVGERELRFPVFGERAPDGSRALHVMVGSSAGRLRMVRIALTASARGLNAVAHTPDLDAFLVDECEVSLRGKRARVSVDGELVRLRQPLKYRFEHAALRVVTPSRAEPP